MSAVKPILDAVKVALATAAPTRVTTRKLEGFAERKSSDLEAGVFTLISKGERRVDQDYSFINCLLVGQLLLGEDVDGEAVEEAELLMIDDIRRFMGGVQGCQVNMKSWSQSQQIELPYGWVAVELELGPFILSSGPDETTLDNFTTLASDFDIAPHVSAAEHIKWVANPQNYSTSAPELKDQLTP